MPYDFKKEYKELYKPSKSPIIVDVPKMNYIAVRGKGNPNEEGGEYQRAIGNLYAIAYTLKMSYKTEYHIEGFFEYVVPPLEGFWWQENVKGYDKNKKEDFSWISVIRLPEFIKKQDVSWAKEQAMKKKKMDYSNVEFFTLTEGKCVQIMHVGPFDEEPFSVAVMEKYICEEGYQNDFSEQRLHHEIYLSDARRVTSDKWKTVIRHPIKKVGISK
jgi:hypothetical protein